MAPGPERPGSRRRPSMLNLSMGTPSGLRPNTQESNVSIRPSTREYAAVGSAPKGIGIGGGGRVARTAADRNAEIHTCVQDFRTELEVLTNWHEEQIIRSIERHTAILSAGWRSAPSTEFKPSRELTIRDSVHTFDLEELEAEAVTAATPRRWLPPPPQPGTPVHPTDAPNILAHVVHFDAKQSSPMSTLEGSGKTELNTALSPRSVSSTRTGSNSNSNSLGPELPNRLGDGVCEIFEQTLCLPGASPLTPQGHAKTMGHTLSATSDHPLKRLSSRWVTPMTTCNGTTPDMLEGSNDSESASSTARASPLKTLDSRWAAPQELTRKSVSYATLAKQHKARNAGLLVSRLTKSTMYEMISAICIVLNAIFIVWETERRAQFAEMHNDGIYFDFVSNVFCVVFVLDLILRILSERLLFLHSSEWVWNVFDIFVCSTALMEMGAQWYARYYNSDQSGVRLFLRKFSMFRMLRILRLLRVIRIARGLRCIRFIRELRLMVFSLTSSLRSLFWSAVLITIILLVFGVFFTDGVVAHCLQEDRMEAESTKAMRMYFGHVTASAISLFMAMTGGEDWGLILESLKPLPPEYTWLFLTFITFAVLALLNLVTAVFINAAMQRSQNDRELAVQQELENKEELSAIIQQVFFELDTNNSGSLSVWEFEKHIEDEKIMAYLRSRGIDICQVRTLFTLLDVDQTGDVSMDEFVQGILRLKGGATSMDLAVLAYQVEYIIQFLSKHLVDQD